MQEAKLRLRWLSVTTTFAIGSAVAAGAVGFSFGSIGWLLARAAAGSGLVWSQSDLQLVLASSAVAYALAGTGFIRLPHPTCASAVPVSWWRRWRYHRAALLYGLALGTGASTRVAFGSLYVVWFWCLLAHSPILGATVCAGFGAARGLAVYVVSWYVRGLVDIGAGLGRSVFANQLAAQYTLVFTLAGYAGYLAVSAATLAHRGL